MMEIVIKIPEDEYNIAKYGQYGNINVDIVRKALANGISLPKGHGRLLDENDILDTDNNDGGWYDLVDMPEYIKGVKEIIEADKESE